MNQKNQSLEVAKNKNSSNHENSQIDIDQNQLELSISHENIEEQKQSSPDHLDNLNELKKLNQQIQLELEQEHIIKYIQQSQDNESKIKYQSNMSYTQFEQQEKVEMISKKVIYLAIVLAFIGLILLILGILEVSQFNKVTLGITFWILALICLTPGIYVIYKIFKISCWRNDEKKILERRQLPDWS